MENKNDKNYKKIKTGVSGLDDLFYGGLRLPNPNGEQGVCIAIYGNRGISKTDLALQIMYGVSNENSEHGTESNNNNRVRRMDITIPSENLKSKYRGLLIGRHINQIKQEYCTHNRTNQLLKCHLCDFFDTDRVLSNLYKGEVRINTSKMSWNDEGKKVICSKHSGKEIRCELCKLIRHEVINYNDRTQALHWTVGDLSDMSNIFAKGNTDYEEKLSEIFKIDDEPDNQYYTDTPIQRFQRIYRAVQGISKIDGTELLDSIVIGGFTAIDDDLKQLPFGELIKTLKEKAKVSALVFDERGKELHLNADILIHMRTREDKERNYLFHELCVEKSDLQRHVYGWHRYKKQRDLSIKVIPNLNVVMSKRFASVYAPIRLERDSMEYRQPLLQKFQDSIQSLKGRDYFSVYADTLGKLLPYEKEYVGHLTVSTNDKDTSQNICDAVISGCDVSIVLFGKNDVSVQDTLLKRLDTIISQKEGETIDKESLLRRIHCWSVRPSDILPEEIVGYLKEYISNWWKAEHDTRRLYLYIDDLSLLGAYPLAENERLFVPAIFSICNEVRYNRDFSQPLHRYGLTLHIVCSDEKCLQYKYVKQLEKWNKEI